MTAKNQIPAHSLYLGQSRTVIEQLGFAVANLELYKDVNKSKENPSIKLNDNIKEFEGLDTNYEAFFVFWCF